MRSLADIEQRLLQRRQFLELSADAAAAELMALSEEILCHWLRHNQQTPTISRKEGFRLLALHRQGCKGDPSFNACRESCRELVYYLNLIQGAPSDRKVAARVSSAGAIAYHLCLFVGGKMKDPELGDFCCSSRPLRSAANGC